MATLYKTQLLLLIVQLILSCFFAHQFYSPAGNIQQVLAASRAADKGSPLVAMRFSDGIAIVTASKNPFSRLRDKGPRQLCRIDDHISIGCTGLLFDALQLTEIAKNICVRYKDLYSNPIPLEVFSRQLGGVLNQLTIASKYRPLGTTCVAIGCDFNCGYQLYELTVDGSVQSCRLSVLGRESGKLRHALANAFENLINTDDDISAVGTWNVCLQQGLPLMLQCIENYLEPNSRVPVSAVSYEPTFHAQSDRHPANSSLDSNDQEDKAECATKDSFRGSSERNFGGQDDFLAVCKTAAGSDWEIQVFVATKSKEIDMPWTVHQADVDR